MNFGSRGWTTKKPIMPIAICSSLVGVWVVHERSALIELELIDERLAWFDVRLCETADTVHSVRKQHAVPMNGGMLG